MVLNHRLGTQSRAAEEKGRGLKEEDDREQKVGRKGGVGRTIEGRIREEREERPGEGRREDHSNTRAYLWLSVDHSQPGNLVLGEHSRL